MPYDPKSPPKDLVERIKAAHPDASAADVRQFIHVFNSASEAGYGEERCFSQAFGVLKKKLGSVRVASGAIGLAEDKYTGELKVINLDDPVWVEHPQRGGPDDNRPVAEAKAIGLFNVLEEVEFLRFVKTMTRKTVAVRLVDGESFDVVAWGPFTAATIDAYHDWYETESKTPLKKGDVPTMGQIDVQFLPGVVFVQGSKRFVVIESARHSGYVSFVAFPRKPLLKVPRTTALEPYRLEERGVKYDGKVQLADYFGNAARLSSRVAFGPSPDGTGWVEKPSGAGVERYVWLDRREGTDSTVMVREMRTGGWGLDFLWDGDIFSWRGVFESAEVAMGVAARAWKKVRDAGYTLEPIMPHVKAPLNWRPASAGGRRLMAKAVALHYLHVAATDWRSEAAILLKEVDSIISTWKVHLADQPTKALMTVRRVLRELATGSERVMFLPAKQLAGIAGLVDGIEDALMKRSGALAGTPEGEEVGKAFVRMRNVGRAVERAAQEMRRH